MRQSQFGRASHRPRPAGGNADRSRESLRLCTGSRGKAYVKVGQKLADLAPQLTAGALKIEVVPTGGSLDNLGKALAGECDAFIAQGDAIDFFVREVQPQAADRFRVVGELYKSSRCSSAAGTPASTTSTRRRMP